MPRIPFFVIDAFTETPFAGNPAGVFFDFEGALSPEQMRRCTGEVSLESAFVLPAEPGSGADYRLRYFTGVTEVPFCGHATLATSAALLHTGKVADGATIRFATNLVTVPATVSGGGPGGGPFHVTITQTPQFRNEPVKTADADDVARALGCDPDFVCTAGLRPQVYSTGTPWLLVPVCDRACVDNAPAEENTLLTLSRKFGVFGVYVFYPDRDEQGQPRVWSRCFAPLAGLDEDPVTGSASGALGWYLSDHDRLMPGETLVTQQGFAGVRGGSACVTVTREPGQEVSSVAVSGSATLVAEGAFLRSE